MSQGLNGLVKEMKEHLNALGIQDLKTISKSIWKRKVKSYIIDLTRKELIEDSMKYKKINTESLKKEEFKRKEYFYSLRLEDIRMKFKLESKVFPTIRNHFKRKYKNRSLRCPSCRNILLSSPGEDEDEVIDTSSHILNHCPAFREQ